MTYSIYTIKVLDDNYVYSVSCDITGNSVIFDAGQVQPILDFLGTEKILETLILTHHHSDHIDGTDTIRQATNCDVFGGKNDMARLPELTKALIDGEKFTILNGLEVRSIQVSGHTIGHMAYYIPALSAVFVGDLLFTMGCGRMFEGTHKLFYESLAKIKKLPLDTRIYGGHEYTKSNIAFAKSIASEMGVDDGFDNYIAQLNTLLEQNIPTVPVFLENEINYNPFLKADSVEKFAEFRLKKDSF